MANSNTQPILVGYLMPQYRITTDDLMELQEEPTQVCGCGRPAVWLYMPDTGEVTSNHYACDNCVPRGCSCNMEPLDGNPDNLEKSNWEEITDDEGRKYPCCEWWWIGIDG